MTEYVELLRQRLKPKRFEHSLGVMETAAKLAEYYACDVEKARLTGLLHDVTKNCDEAEQLAMFKKYNIPCDEGLMKSKSIFHQITGAYFVKNELGIEDSEIFNGIRYHTTGRAAMTLFEKIIYVADFIEPNRDYDIVDELRSLAYENIDKTCFIGSQWCLEKNINKGYYIYKDTFEFYNSLTEVNK